MFEKDDPAMTDELCALARDIIDTNRYLTLATADHGGNPWASPVYFASAGYRQFYWVSTLDAVHSLNIAERPRVGIVIFDSTVPAYHGRAVYVTAEATSLTANALDEGLTVYPGPPSRGGSALSREDVTGSAPYRLFRATASELSVLCPRPPRQPCALHGIAKDHRTPIT